MKHAMMGNTLYTVGKIVCVGRNYALHIKELGHEFPDQPLFFLKPASAIIYSGEDVIYPSFSDLLHYETELVVLIGRTVKDVSESEAENAIAGFGVGFDMTLRDIQNEEIKKGNPWTVSKCFDTSAVISEFVPKEECNIKADTTIKLSVNGEIKQHAELGSMIFKPAQLISFISSRITLEEGDLIFTGTPEGVGPVQRGDILEAEITSVGKLKARIK